MIYFPKNLAYFKHDDIFLIPPQITCLPSNSIVTVRYALGCTYGFSYTYRTYTVYCTYQYAALYVANFDRRFLPIAATRVL